MQMQMQQQRAMSSRQAAPRSSTTRVFALAQPGPFRNTEARRKLLPPAQVASLAPPVQVSMPSGDGFARTQVGGWHCRALLFSCLHACPLRYGLLYALDVGVACPARLPCASCTGNSCLCLQDGAYDLSAKPPFTLQDLRNAIPAQCWEKNVWRSMGSLFVDVAVVLGLAAVAYTVNQW